MAGARARDTSPAKPISELSRHGMLLRSISAPLRSLANKLTEEMALLRDPEGGAANGPAVTSRITHVKGRIVKPLPVIANWTISPHLAIHYREGHCP
jgi:hypothetical protein